MLGANCLKLSALLRVLRKFFLDSSVAEVFSLFKEKLNPLDASLAIYVLFTFLKISRRVPAATYAPILEEVIELSKHLKGKLGDQFLLYFVDKLMR